MVGEQPFLRVTNHPTDLLSTTTQTHERDTQHCERSCCKDLKQTIVSHITENNQACHSLCDKPQSN